MNKALAALISATGLALAVSAAPAREEPASPADPGAPEAPAASSREFPRPHYERAQGFYAQGPSRARDILRELRLQLQETPEHQESHFLLGVTLFGVGEFDAAAASFRRSIDIGLTPDEEGGITAVPFAMVHEAKSLLMAGRPREAKLALNKYYGFIASSSDKALLKDFRELARACVEAIRAHSALSACDALKTKGFDLKEGYYFFVVDKANAELFSGFDIYRPYLLDVSGKSDWRTVFAVHRDAESNPSYAAYYEGEEPILDGERLAGVSYLPPLGELPGHTPESRRALVEKNFQPVEPGFEPEGFPPDGVPLLELVRFTSEDPDKEPFYAFLLKGFVPWQGDGGLLPGGAAPAPPPREAD